MVYVDNMKASFGRMLMCHMFADTSVELLAMAERIGLNKKWIQHAGTYREHFDVSREKRRLAVTAGAVEITMKQAGKLLRDRNPSS